MDEEFLNTVSGAVMVEEEEDKLSEAISGSGIQVNVCHFVS